jgi:exonuclease 3'-5' domain-containing protein 1
MAYESIGPAMDDAAAQSPTNAVGHDDERSPVFIDSPRTLQSLLKTLDGLPTKPPSIYLDATGVGRGQLTDLQLLSKPSNTLYIIRKAALHTMAISSTAANDHCSLRHVLESESIWKVGFDLREVSRLLFLQFNISLNGVYDLQLMELASRDGPSKKYLTSFAKSVETGIPSSNAINQRWLQPNDSTRMHLFNSLGHVPRQEMRRVELFHEMWTAYRRKLGRPGEAFWLNQARYESNQRVKTARSNDTNQQTQALGPLMWWDFEMRQAAMDDWNDDLRIEEIAGDWILNKDAEWVPKAGLRG